MPETGRLGPEITGGDQRAGDSQLRTFLTDMAGLIGLTRTLASARAADEGTNLLTSTLTRAARPALTRR